MPEYQPFEAPVLREPEMTLTQAKEAVAQKTAPRVSEESIKAKIKSVDYLPDGQLTICKITMQNGFMVIGHSAPASPENYDYQVGKRYAYENAFRQLWQLEGYLLRETLALDHRHGLMPGTTADEQRHELRQKLEDGKPFELPEDAAKKFDV